MSAWPSYVLEAGDVGFSIDATRLVVALTFFANGLVFGTWVSRIPDVQQSLALRLSELGTALFFIAVGAFVAMPVTGRVLTRFDGRTVTAVGGIAFCVLLPVLATIPNLAALIVVLVAFGAANGMLDVAMNEQAVSVERRYGRTIMPSFHTLFSFGGLVGSAAGGIAASWSASVLAHFLAAGLVGGTLILLAASRLISTMTPARSSGMARPSRAQFLLGIMAFAVLLSEGAVADWAAVYLAGDLRTGPGLAPLGYAVFSLSMVAGRLGGDWLARWLGPVPLVRGGAALAAMGMAGALLLRDPMVAIIGFGLAGAGMSVIFPLIISAAGNTPGAAPGPAVATMSTAGYTGFLVGPAAIGYIAEAATLTGALSIVVCLTVLVSAFGGSVRDAGKISARR